MKQKLNIEYFSPEGVFIDERSVEQAIEFTNGPKFTHKGPFRIKFSLWDKEDVDKAILYLQQLSGQVEVTKKEPKVSLKKLGDDPTYREELIKQVKSAKNQAEAISLLRKEGFVFMLYDRIQHMFPTLDPKSPSIAEVIKDMHRNKYQWMLKANKIAKNPENDKLDPTLVFGFEILPTPQKNCVVYLYNELERFKLEIKEYKQLPFQAVEFTKFPEYMTEEERERFRKEQRILDQNPETPKTKFFLRWEPYVIIRKK